MAGLGVGFLAAGFGLGLLVAGSSPPRVEVGTVRVGPEQARPVRGDSPTGTIPESTAGGVPSPNFDRVDYAHPEKYLDLPETVGRRETIEEIAAEVKAKANTPRDALGSIGGWISSHLKNDGKLGYEFRTVDRILADGALGGCQDHSEVFGHLARACGIPTVWVKTMDCAWIRMFRRTRDENRTWSGHVFLEVHLDGKWALLDATQGVLYEDYDTRQRILPGDRYAYDKGGDYFGLVMSDRWGEWKKQTAAHFRNFDLSLLPVGEGTLLPHPGVIVIAGNNPEWRWATERAQALGLPTGTGGNAGFEQWMPRVREGMLVVTCLDGRTVLPDEYQSWLPEGWEGAVRKGDSGILRGKAPNGTPVLLVYGKDLDALRAEIGTLTFDEPK